MPAQQDLALFPLGTVLVPGARLPLRIFEPRYVDMVSQCMREQAPFGVVLITRGNETSSQVHTASIGCSARIIDFETLADGLLGLMCRGERRFRILSCARQHDGLNRAEVEWFDEALPCALDPQFASLAAVLRAVFEQLARAGHTIEAHYDDASWVSYRLAEYLPLELNLQQQLLEMEDANARLALLAPLIDTSRVERDH